MERKFYQLVDDEYIEKRWYLDEVISECGKIDVWNLSIGKRIQKSFQLIMPIQHNGIPLDFTMAAFDVPVVKNKIADVFETIAPKDVQVLPVKIEDDTESYKILNIIKSLDCVDENKSEFDLYTEVDDLPDKIGQYRTIYDLKIDKSKIDSNDHCFRIVNWEVALIISDVLKKRLEEIGVFGAKFLAV